MSPEFQPLRFEKIIQASVAQIYRAFTHSGALIEWFCNTATVNPKPGGHIFLAWNAGYYMSGEYLELEPDRRVIIRWHGRNEPAPTRLEIAWVPNGENTHLRLEHSGMGSDETWSDIVNEFKKGWQSGLENLASVLETGEDRRFTRRPMLGITPSDFDAEIARQIGVPVSQGIRLDTIVEGMGAQAAGLRANDVIVKIGQHEISDYRSLQNALQSHYAGEAVEVTYYRGPEKITIQMKLSGRHIPEVPTSAAALSEALRLRYTELEGQIDQLFANISEAEASFKPSSGEWSAKEVLAHLIHGERGWQSWVSDLAGGHEPHYDEYPDNFAGRQIATIAAYPTLPDLILELKRSMHESAALVANLPAAFSNQKGTYWRLATGALESPYHHYNHFDQIRAAIQSARGG